MYLFILTDIVTWSHLNTQPIVIDNKTDILPQIVKNYHQKWGRLEYYNSNYNYVKLPQNYGIYHKHTGIFFVFLKFRVCVKITLQCYSYYSNFIVAIEFYIFVLFICD